MKEKIKVTAVVMFLGVIFSGILVAYKLVNTIIPSFDGGSASVFRLSANRDCHRFNGAEARSRFNGTESRFKKDITAGYAKNVENFGQTRSSACAYRSA